MSMVEGLVQSKSRKGNSIKVNDEWYSVFSADKIDNVDWKDKVRFEFTTKGTFKNIKGGVEVLAKGDGASSGGSTSGAKTGYSNVGVSMGHAWNSAERIVLEQIKANNEMSSVSTEDILKGITDVSVDIYKLMETLRGLAERGFDTLTEDSEEARSDNPF